MKKHLLFIIGLFALITSIKAQTPQLLKDIQAGPSSTSITGNFNVALNKLFFRSNAMLYITDGTANGTISLNSQFGSGHFLENNGKVYYKGSDGNGNELWVTDATPAGTYQLYDGYVSNNFNPILMGILNNKVMFRATDSINGSGLWSSDGTVIGTSIVKRVAPYVNAVSGVEAILLNSKMIFGASDGINGDEPWITDGTNTGTYMLKNINTDTTGLIIGSFPGGFTRLNSKVLFQAQDVPNGMELWITDGTQAGTVLLRDLEPGSTGSYPDQLMLHNNKVYFTAGDIFSYGKRKLYSTDGTAAGTVVIDDSVGNIHIFNNEVYYGKAIGSGSNPTHFKYGLYKTDGTAAGCTKLSELPSTHTPSNPFRFASAGSKLFFVRNYSPASSIDPDNELWVTEGTPASTHVVMSGTNPDSTFLCKSLAFITSYNDEVYVLGLEDSAVGNEIYKFDGLSTSLVRLKLPEANVSVFPNPANSNIHLTVSNNMLMQQVKISNARGQIVYEYAVQNSTTANIDIAGLAAGVYFAQIQLADGQLAIGRFVKE